MVNICKHFNTHVYNCSLLSLTSLADAVIWLRYKFLLELRCQNYLTGLLPLLLRTSSPVNSLTSEHGLFR